MAGNGTYGYSGDGGAATAAELSLPAGVALNSTGNLYIADRSNSLIREVSSGLLLTIAPASLTITVDHPARPYGTANPDLTVSYSASSTAKRRRAWQCTSLLTTATTTSTVGTYPITAAWAYVRPTIRSTTSKENSRCRWADYGYGFHQCVLFRPRRNLYSHGQFNVWPPYGKRDV